MNDRKVMMLPITEILLGDNPREDFDPTALAELMQSMKHSGLLSPVGVRKIEATGRWKLVFGGRRYLAAQRLGWDNIECIEVDVTDEKDALIKTSTENVIRENVSLPEQGRIFNTLLKKGMTSEQVAVRMGCKKAFVLNALEAFNRIPKKFHEQITYGTRGQMHEKGQIPASVALVVVDIKRDNKITDTQVGQLMKWAADKGINSTKMRLAGKMIGDGAEPQKAMDKVEYMRSVSFTVTMKISVIQKLQKKYGMSIHDIMYKYLENNEEFDLTTNRLQKSDDKATPSELIRAKKRRRNT